jgi:hypothetical protein
MISDDKVRENRLRRMANRQGLLLRKSRRRDPNAWDYGTFELIDPSINATLIPSPTGRAYGISLDQIERELESGRLRCR